MSRKQTEGLQTPVVFNLAVLPAGRGIANPVAMILAVAMMLEWLNHPETLRGAARIRRAVENVLADRARRTPVWVGTLGPTR